MKAYAGLVVGLLLALFAAGCAGSSRGVAADGASAAAFIAPDGARATPNTGASRLADGPGSAMDGAASPGGVTSTTGTASLGGTQVGGDGVVFSYAGGGSSVNLAGDFNSWSADADPMVRQADGSFRLAKKLEPGRYAYKFVVDGQWQADPKATETVDDGFGGKNSVIVVAGAAGTTGAPPAATPAPGVPSPASGEGRPPEVTTGGVRFTFGGAARTVHLAGDFNAWSISSDPLVRGADGTWTIVKTLPAGTHAYKFVVDGTTWKSDEANPSSVDDGFGGKNSLVTVP